MYIQYSSQNQPESSIKKKEWHKLSLMPRWLDNAERQTVPNIVKTLSIIAVRLTAFSTTPSLKGFCDELLNNKVLCAITASLTAIGTHKSQQHQVPHSHNNVVDTRHLISRHPYLLRRSRASMRSHLKDPPQLDRSRTASERSSYATPFIRFSFPPLWACLACSTGSVDAVIECWLLTRSKAPSD